jgi:hypothetical protein
MIGLGYRVLSEECRMYGLGFRVQGSGFDVVGV